LKNLDPSYHQERLWFIERFEKGKVYPHAPVYHNALIPVFIRGQVDTELLQQAFEILITQYEILHTKLITKDQQPRAETDTGFRFKLQLEEGGANVSNEESAVDAAIEWARQPMDIEGPLLLKVMLYRYHPARSTLAIVMHHAIADQATLVWVANKIFEYYSLLDAGNEIPSPVPAVSYHEFAAWQKKLPEDTMDELLFYWRRQLNHGRLEALQLPADFMRNPFHVYNAGFEQICFGAAETAMINGYCKKNICTKKELLFTVFSMLLFRYSGQEEIVVGMPVNSREKHGITDLPGPVSNLVVLKANLTAETPVNTCLADCKKLIADAELYSDMPFDKLVLELAPEKDMSRTALFDVLFQYEKEPIPMQTAKLHLTFDLPNAGWGKYDLNLLFYEKAGNELSCKLTYNTCLYKQDSIQRMLAHFRELLSSFLNERSKTTGTLEYLTREEKEKILVGWNNTGSTYPLGLTIHKRIEEQAVLFPENTAVIFAGQQLTYRQFNEQANKLAWHLVNNYSFKYGDFAGILLDRSAFIPVSILAILKAGGTYIPLDPSHPAERVNYILKDCACKILLTETSCKEKFLADYEHGIIDLSEMDFSSGDTADLPQVNEPSDTAYIIYTSGTTGHPKGCMVTHENVIRLLVNDKLPFSFGNKDVWIMAHSYCFDFSVWEMYGALFYGGALVIPEWEDVRDTSRWLKVIKHHRVTVLNQTPAAFYLLAKEETGQEVIDLHQHLRYVCFGGERLELSYLQNWISIYPPGKPHLVNMYGITETTVHVTFHFITEEDVVRSNGRSIVGKPLPETTLYILDRQLQPVAPGVKGEIYVGATGVCKGYLGNETLTNERFIPSPYDKGGRLYKTGDTGCFRTDGNVEYLGRNDSQVKIRGYRIELAEIENVMLGHPAVDKVLVTTTADKDNLNSLVAYYTLRTKDETFDMRTFLRTKLPEYMVPAFYIAIESFPLTSNGKIDTRRLPDPVNAVKGEGKKSRDAGTVMEKKLQATWMQVLNRDTVGIQDNFFEIGGHSLKAVQLISAIHKQTGIHLELQDVFQHVTIEALATFLEGCEQTMLRPVKRIKEQKYYELSHAQLRLYTLCQAVAGSVAYNMPAAIHMKKPLSPSLIDDILQALANRHESLRTVFVNINGKPWQKIIPAKAFSLKAEWVDLNGQYSQGEMLKQLQAEERAKQFDFSNGPLIRVKILRLRENEHIILCTMHHIICDGISIQVLMREMLQLYRDFSNGLENSLPELKLQYKDYAAWHNQEISGNGEPGDAAAFWKTYLNDAGVELDLPLDNTRAGQRNYKGGNERQVFDNNMANKLAVFNKAHGTTMYMTVMAVLKILIYKYTGQRDIIVGTAVSGRNHPDLASQVGLYVNTVAVKDTIDPALEFSSFLGSVRENLLTVYRYQDYPFDKLLNDLEIIPQPNRHPLFDIMLNEPPSADDMLSEIDGAAPLDIMDADNATAKFDLLFSLVNRNGHAEIGVEYDAGLFSQPAITRMLVHFCNLLNQVIETPGKTIAELDIMDEAEHNAVEQTAFKALGKENETTPLLPVLEKYGNCMIYINETAHTYKELLDESQNLANGLSAVGIKPGDHLALYLTDQWHILLAQIALVRLQCVTVPVPVKAVDSFPGKTREHIKPAAWITGGEMDFKTGCRVYTIHDLLRPVPGENVSSVSIKNPGLYACCSFHPSMDFTNKIINADEYFRYCRAVQLVAGFNQTSVVYAGADEYYNIFLIAILPALFAGANLVIREQGSYSLAQFEKAGNEHKITHAFLNNDQWYQWAGVQLSIPSLEYLLGNNLQQKKTNLIHTGGERFLGIINLTGNISTLNFYYSLLMPGEPVPALPKVKPLGNRVLTIRNSSMQLVPVNIAGDLYFDYTGEQHAGNHIAVKDRVKWLNNGCLQVQYYDPSIVWMDGMMLDKARLEKFITKHLKCIDCSIVNLDPGSDYAYVLIVATAEKLTLARLTSMLGEVLPASFLENARLLSLPAIPLNQAGIPDKYLLRKMGMDGSGLAGMLKEELESCRDVQDFVVEEVLLPVAGTNLDAEMILEEYWWNKQAGNNPDEGHENNILPQSREMAYSSGGKLVIDPGSPVTLTQALLRTAELYPGKGITFISQDGTEIYLSYPALLKEAKCVLTGLRKAGLHNGDRVLLQIRESNRHFSVFWGCVLGGIIPVTIAVPHTYRSGNAVLGKLLNTWQLLDGSSILCSEALLEDIAECGREMNLSLNALSISDLLNNDPAEELYEALPDDLVFFQLSSGSTGVPKCIQEKHSSIIWHIHASAKYCSYTPDDITLNWLPFDHVVPTLTFHLKDVYLGISQTELETNLVLNAPLKWLDYMEQFRVTHSWSPNFGFKLVADELSVKTGNWNLSPLKFLMNAGEQVTLSVVKRFLESTAVFRIKPAVMQPAFGMAEVCTCMTYENDFNFDRVHYVKKNSLKGKLQFVKKADSSTTTFVELGLPSFGHEIRITDEYNELVEEGVIGRFQIRGGSVTTGYVNNPEANSEAFAGEGWFNSGDLGFIQNGRLTLTGREKETIIIRGANFYCYELEDEMGFVESVLSTYVASCGIQNRTTGTEELVLFYSPDPLVVLENRITIKKIKEAITRKFGVNPAFVIPIRAADFSKTTSGKIQRKKMKDMFEAGHFDNVIRDTGQEKTGNDLPQFFYEKTWRKKRPDDYSLPRPKTILIFLTGDILLNAENAGGSIYIKVFPGEAFLQTGEFSFTVSPGDETHCFLLFEQLKAMGLLPGQVIHLWNYRRNMAGSLSRQDIEQTNRTGLYSIHALAKAMLETVLMMPLMIVTSGMQEVVKTDKTDCTSSALQGFVKTMVQEQPTINCKLIDIPFTDKQDLLTILQVEMMQHDGETELAYRAGVRYISGLSKIRIPSNFKPRVPLIQGGLYLLTGGLGGAGKRIAKEMLVHYNVSLLIIGRTDFESTPVDQWPGSVKEKWDTYQSLSKNGHVIYRSVNVEDAAALKKTVGEAILISEKPLSGIFHLAGELDEHARHWNEVDKNLLHHKKRSDFEKMFSAKIYGTIALNELIAAEPGLLFVVFSSVNSYFGAYSYSEYAAASSFLDYFIRFQRSYQQTNAMAINWSMWEDTGMNRNNHMKTMIISKGFAAIRPDQAIQSFWLAMGLQRAQVFAGLDSGNWGIQKYLEVEKYFKEKVNVYYAAEQAELAEQALLDIINKTGRNSRLPVSIKQVSPQFLLADGRINKESPELFSGDDHFSTYTPPVTENEKKLAKIFHEMLEQQLIGITDSFFELGVNSVKLASIISRLQELFPGRIGISDLFEKPNIQLLASMLDGQEQEPATIKTRKVNKLKF